MKNQKKFAINDRAKSFVYAFKGIRIFFATQHNVRIHSVIATIVVISGLILKINITEWCFIVFAIGFVFVAEAINTAIEYLVDFVSPEYNKTAGKIKDIAAGAVLIASIASVIAGLIIFIPKFSELL